MRFPLMRDASSDGFGTALNRANPNLFPFNPILFAMYTSKRSPYSFITSATWSVFHSGGKFVKYREEDRAFGGLVSCGVQLSIPLPPLDSRPQTIDRTPRQ